MLVGLPASLEELVVLQIVVPVVLRIVVPVVLQIAVLEVLQIVVPAVARYLKLYLHQLAYLS